MPASKLEQEKLNAAAKQLKGDIAEFRGRYVTPVLVAFVLSIWIAVNESFALGRMSAIWFTVGWQGALLVLVRFVFPAFAENELLRSNGSRILILSSWIYLVLAEYVLGISHVDHPARAGILFQHAPTYLALMVADNWKEALVGIAVWTMLALPLANSWWQIHDLVLHTVMVCFAAWIKTYLFDLVQKCEELLDLREAVMQETVSAHEQKVQVLNKELKTKEVGQAELTKKLAQVQQDYIEMSNMAEEAVSMMTTRRRGHR